MRFKRGRAVRRFDILKGDMTTVGGIVQGGDARDILHDREQAYEQLDGLFLTLGYQ